MTPERLEELRKRATQACRCYHKPDELIRDIDRLNGILAETHSAAWLASVAAIEVFADGASGQIERKTEHIDAMLEATGHLRAVTEGGKRLPAEKVVAKLKSWIAEIESAQQGTTR